MRLSVRWVVASATALLCLTTAGCAQLFGVFDPEFLSALGAGSSAATIPGDAPAISVGVENRTSKVVQAFISYRTSSDTVQSFVSTVAPGERVANALVCPVTEITLGDVSDLSRVGAVVRLGNGTLDDPFTEVEPFGVLLLDGANYNCGDGVTFAVLTSGETASGYQTYAYIQRSQAPAP